MTDQPSDHIDVAEAFEAVESLERKIHLHAMQTFIKEKGLWPEYIFFEIRVWAGMSNLAKWVSSLSEDEKGGLPRGLKSDGPPVGMSDPSGSFRTEHKRQGGGSKTLLGEVEQIDKDRS